MDAKSLLNCNETFHPMLPIAEAAKSIYDDTAAADKCITLIIVG